MLETQFSPPIAALSK